MKKDDLLKLIAETGYNVGFGAKKHFATYDIVEKAPGLIGFLSLVFGTYSLVWDGLSTDFLSATFVILGVVSLYISFYNHDKDSYEKAGIELTKLFNQLKSLYYEVKNLDSEDLSEHVARREKLEQESYSHSISKQIALSDWITHYKFFWQHQIEWLDEQKKFTFFRDKVPLSLTAFCVIIVFFSTAYFFDLMSLACKVMNQR